MDAVGDLEDVRHVVRDENHREPFVTHAPDEFEHHLAFLYAERGGGFGVHNPKYAAELLYDSYFALTGLPLATFPQRP